MNKCGQSIVMMEHYELEGLVETIDSLQGQLDELKSWVQRVHEKSSAINYDRLNGLEKSTLDVMKILLRADLETERRGEEFIYTYAVDETMDYYRAHDGQLYIYRPGEELGDPGSWVNIVGKPERSLGGYESEATFVASRLRESCQIAKMKLIMLNDVPHEVRTATTYRTLEDAIAGDVSVSQFIKDALTALLEDMGSLGEEDDND